MTSPLQKILFGSPGTGKSHSIDHEIIPKLKIDQEKHPENVIKTVFHPEYTYGDFMGKLVPITQGDKVRYRFYEGHFLKALTQAYKNIIDNYNDPTKDKNLNFKSLSNEDKIIQLNKARNEACFKSKNVALVVDEINRGNSSAIFGTIFQLLDRDDDGWSSYSINITEIELMTILKLIGVEEKRLEKDEVEYKFPGESDWVKSYLTFQNRVNGLNLNLADRAIKVPPNLSILATMNTSDNSIYFMDSAFKRRWDWEFVNWDESKPQKGTYGNSKNGTLDQDEWFEFVKKINTFIKNYHTSIRGIEDKQIGKYFIKAKQDKPVTAEQIQNKLMFFLWDSVFNRDKKPLLELLEINKNELVTFGDFTHLHNEFVAKIKDKY